MIFRIGFFSADQAETTYSQPRLRLFQNIVVLNKPEMHIDYLLNLLIKITVIHG